MKKEFVQVTCTKDNGDFILCSNLGLMDNPHDGVTPAMAMEKLYEIARQAAVDGYNVKWTIEPLSEFDLEFYGDLFA
jgi:hypothetical protein